MKSDEKERWSIDFRGIKWQKKHENEENPHVSTSYIYNSNASKKVIEFRPIFVFMSSLTNEVSV